MRRVFETIIEMTSRATPRTAALNWAAGFSFNRNRARLSFEAHLYAQSRNFLVTIGKLSGLKHFMCWPTFEDFSTEGLLARYAWQVKTTKEWRIIFDGLSKNKKQIVPFPGLGLHHGSNELYYPMPNTLVESAKIWSREKRAEWRSLHVKEAA